MPFGLNPSSGPVGELTAPENSRQMTTVRKRTAWLLSLYEAQNSVFNPEFRNLLADAISDPAKGRELRQRFVNNSSVPKWWDASERFVNLYPEYAKAVGGEFRKDAVDAMKAVTPESVGLTVTGSAAREAAMDRRGL